MSTNRSSLYHNIRHSLREIRYTIASYIEARRVPKSITKSQFQIYFCPWYEGDVDAHPIVRLIKGRKLLGDRDLKVAIFHPKRREYITFDSYIKSDIKIFYTGENLKWQPLLHIADHTLQRPYIDLALGFEYFENRRYVRLPLWVEYMFDLSMSEEQIRGRYRELMYPKISNRPLRCTLVASHDHSNLTTSEVGIRTLIHNALIHTIEIDCPGRFMHNDDSLQRDFADNKVEYLKGYTFNICPENSNASGYVTEKIFESIKSGCIPIYWGSYNNPEPDILNHEAILFFDRKNPQKLVAELTELISNPKKLGEFLARPRLKAGGEEVIINMLREVELRLKNIIAQR